MSITPYPTLRLKLSQPPSLKTKFSMAASVTALNQKVNRAGDIMTGYLIANADPITGLGYATKQYVDAHAAGVASVNAMGGPAILIAAGTGISIANSANTVTVTNTGAGLTVGTTAISNGVNARFLYDNAGVLGEYTGTQATAQLDLFTSSVKGLTPASGGGTTTFLRADGTWTVAGAALPNYLGGLTLSNDGVSPNTVLDIASGGATSDDNTTTMLLQTAFTKTTGAWAVGTGNGALDTGSVGAAVWYHVFLIERTDTSVVDVLFSLNATSPTMPASYTKKRRIGSFKTASSNIVPFTQKGDWFLWITVVKDVDSAAIGNSRTVAALTVPPNTIALIRANQFNASGGNHLLLQPIAETDGSPGFAAVPGSSLYAEQASGGAAGDFEVSVDGSSQIALRASTGSTNVRVYTRGWIDNRGR